MAKGISIGVAVDGRDVQKGIKSGIIDPLDDAQDALEDVAKAGDKAGDKLESSFKDQQRETEQLRKTYRKLNDEISEGSSKSASKSKQNVKETAHETSEAVETVKKETLANASETFSSFDGSASSFADGIQGIFGGVVADLGPVGAAIGAAGAIGVGLLSTALQATAERAQELKQKASDLTSQFIETGKVGRVAISYVADQMKTLATQTDDGKDSLVSLRKEAKAAGLDVKDYQLANAGAAQATKTQLAKAREEYDKISDAIRDSGDMGTDAERKRRTALGNSIGKLLELDKVQRDAAQSAKDYFASGSADIEQAGAAAENYADAVQDAYQQAGADISDYVKNGKFDLDSYQKKVEENTTTIVNYQANMATATAQLGKDGHDKAIQYLESLGPDAAPLIAAFIKAPAAQQKSLEATWDILGGAASSSFNSGLQTNLDATPTTKTVKIKVDSSDLAAYWEELRAHPQKIPVSFIPTTNGSGVRVP